MPRPKKEIDYTLVEKYAGFGFTDVEIGYLLDVSKQTINNWKRDEKFLDSLKKGKAKADANVTERLYEKAMKGDTTAMIFWLKNRRRKDWSDKPAEETISNGASDFYKRFMNEVHG